jgi:hypothetical protein
MTDYLTNLSARSLNKARVVRPRVPMRFEPQNKMEQFYKKESRKIAEIDEKRQKQYLMNSFVTENIEVEPEMLFPRVKKLPISKSQTPQRTSITNKMITHQAQTKHSEQHEVISHQIQIQQPEQPEKKIAKDKVSINKVMRPRQASQISATNKPKLKIVVPYGYPRLPLQQDSVTTQPLAEAVYINYTDETFTSPKISKSLMDETQKNLITASARRKTFASIPANQHKETGQFESDKDKIFLPEKRVRSNHLDTFTEIPRLGRIFTPQVIKKYSQGLEVNAQKTTVEEKSIQVTIGRIEIRAVPQAMPQKQQKAPKVLSLEDYSKRHTQEVDR